MTELRLTRLPAAFYEQTRPLQIIRQAAQASDVTPDALLAAVLARIAAATPYTIGLHYKRGSLNFFSAIVGSPGSGKSQAVSAATRLLPDVQIDHDGVPCGTGEGLLQLFCPKAKSSSQDTPPPRSAYLTVDEVGQLLAVNERKGAILLPTMRTMFGGLTAGTTNADAATTRLLKLHTYRLGAVVLFQAANAAQFVTNGVDVGDPQRFLWVDAEIDPDAPDWPPHFPTLSWQPPQVDDRQLTLPREVVDALTIDRLAKRRGHRPPNINDHDIYLHHKIAGLLQLLHDPNAQAIEAATWNMAAQVVGVSRQNRELLREYSQQVKEYERRTKNVDRIKDSDEREQHKESRAVKNLADRIVKYLAGQGKAITFAQIQQQVTSNATRDYLPGTLDELVDAGTITRRLTPNGKGAYYDLPERK